MIALSVSKESKSIHSVINLYIMNLKNFVSILLLVWGTPSGLAIKPPIKAIAQAIPKVYKGLKKVATLSKDQSKSLKNVIRIRDGLEPDTWQQIEDSIRFFKNVKEFLRSSNVTVTGSPDGYRDEEILVCKPSTKGSKCHSTCETHNAKYQFCWTNRAHTAYDYCSCKVRLHIKHWIQLMKKQLVPLAKKMEVKNLNEALAKNDTTQWIVIITLAVLLLVLVVVIIVRMVFNYYRENGVIVQQAAENIEIVI